MSEQNSHFRAAFPTTSWTLIRRAQDRSDEQRAAMLNELLRRYWKPIYAFIRAKGVAQHQAEDLIQEFLHGFVEGDKITKFARREIRFRSWLRTCVGNFLRDRHRREVVANKGDLVSFVDLQATDGRPYEPADEDPEEAFTEGWRRDVLEHALQAVFELSQQEGRVRDYEVFRAYYCSKAGEKVTWKQIAREFGLTDWKEATHKAEWIKEKLAAAIRAEIRVYVDDETEVDLEIRRLL